MGAEPWSYFVPYQSNLQAALDALKKEEFEAGRFYAGYDDDEDGPAILSIQAAREMAEADGTRSILDMDQVIDQPHEPQSDDPKFCCVAPLSEDQLLELFNTTKPTRAMIEENDDFYEWIDRGTGIYIIAHDKAGQPAEIFFAGYSYD